MSLFLVLLKIPPLKRVLFRLAEHRARFFAKSFFAHLEPQSRIVDIGAGPCNMALMLIEDGHEVIPVDIKNMSFSDKLSPIIYDGKKLPVGDKSCNYALLMTVLHHTSQPEDLIAEATRVSKKLIIIEDVFSGIVHKYVTFWLDNFLNLEFFGAPHTNKTDTEWRKTFSSLGLKLAHTKSLKSYGVLTHKVYLLDTP